MRQHLLSDKCYSVKKLRDYFTDDILNWLEENNLKYKDVATKVDKGNLSIVFNDHYCLKIYDRVGHGFGVTVNLAEGYDESIYDNDSFTLTWSYKYLNIKESASFNSRTENQYLQNLPNLISDLKQIIPRLNQMNSVDWASMKEWITKEALKQFG